MTESAPTLQRWRCLYGFFFPLLSVLLPLSLTILPADAAPSLDWRRRCAHAYSATEHAHKKKRNSIAAAAEGHEDAKPFLVLKEGDRRQENDCCGGVGGGGRTERQRSTFMHMRKGGSGGAEGGGKRGGEDAHPAPLLISSLVMQP